ncbi:MAG: toprim domain-containing protein, partial [Caulobacteraceae bacterium]
MTAQLSATALDFLAGRGIDVELAVSMGLFSEKAAGGGGADVLVFPFKRDGKVVNHKRRRLPKDGFWQDKGAPKALWNEDCLRDDSLLSQTLIITEGELDALAAIQSGFSRTVSVPDGAPPPGERKAEDLEGAPKYAWLPAVKKLLHSDRAPNIIIAADDDANGGALLHDLALQLGRPRCKYLVYPKASDPNARGRDRLKDLNEVLEDYGPVGVKQTIEGARFLKVDGKFRMSELPEPPLKPVWQIDEAFPLLSENMRFRPGDVSVCTGIPSYGKTTLVNAIWNPLTIRYGLKIVWASFEQETKPDHQRNLRNWYLQTADLLMHPGKAEADAWIDRHHIFLKPSEDEDATLDR